MRVGPGTLRVEIASLSDTGRQRTSNEDAFVELCRPDGLRLLMVADGMGGHAAGETASHTAVETARNVVKAALGSPDEALRQAFEAANRAIHEAAERDAKLHGMGTTGVALLAAPSGRCWVAHVGDSRAYRLRGERLEALTEDHSFVAELQRRGLIDAAEAAVHPRRHQVLRSLGIEPEVEVELRALEVEPGDCVLLCSDGLSGVVDEAEIAERLASQDPAEAARSLVELANERGGPDNITVQIARFSSAAEQGASRLRHAGLAALGALALLTVFWLLRGL